MIRIDASSVREVRAMVRGLKFVDKEWLKVWTLTVRNELGPLWRRELEASRPNRLQSAVLVRTSSVAASRRAVQLRAGTKGRVSSGASAATLAKAAEFGVDPRLKSRYVRKDKPTPAPASHVVTRRTGRAFGPEKKTGNVVYPALKRFVPRAAAIAVDAFYDLLRRIPGVD